jgi:hypothetical protein
MTREPPAQLRKQARGGNPEAKSAGRMHENLRNGNGLPRQWWGNP